jgi:major membrane immunogen (membrane-anchored lipoprotein)
MKKRIVPMMVALLLVLSSCTTVGLVEEAAAVKTGLSIIPDFTSSKEATAEAEGLAQIDTTITGVTLDAEGKIVNCVIDVAQVKIKFDATGKITSDLTAPVLTKNQLGDEYGMRKASPIGKEWNEQAAAFAAYCIGKTAEEVAGIAVDEKTHPTDADLTAGATMAIGDMIKGVVAACENARDLGAQATDTLGIATDIDLVSRSKDAADDASGAGYSYAYYAAVTLNADGQITSAALNAAQFQVAFDKEGKITTDLTAAQLDKQQLKDDYGMRKASPIGKEWYEQADFFAEYAKGKTADEILSIAVDESGHSTDADVLTGATVTIDSFQRVIADAAATAK